MHKFNFRFGDPIKYRRLKAVFIKRQPGGLSTIMTLKRGAFLVYDVSLAMNYAGTFTLRKARGGWRYNVQGLNGEIITTSEVLKAKQSATEMHERHYRAYKLIDKTITK